MSADDRFWAKVNRNGPIPEHRPNLGPCWQWTASIKKNGYGQFNADGHNRIVRAHRYAYEAMNGPIPAGYDLDHLCRNRACVNPAHLEPVTRRVNLLRGETNGGIVSRTGRCLRGHDLSDPRNIYWRKDRPGKWNCLACLRERRTALRRVNQDALLCDVNGVLFVYAKAASHDH